VVGARQAVDPVRRGVEQHRVARLRRFDAQADGQDASMSVKRRRAWSLATRVLP
jgi:hypothetical protein